MNRICIFAGHYGSGKTENALYRAFCMKREFGDATICDLDIVNPYFRTADAQEELEKSGIRVISNEYVNTNLDMPTVPGEVTSVFLDPSCHAVLDVGGDDDGAICLGQYYPYLKDGGYEMYLVFNLLRPDTATPQQIAEMAEKIQAVSRLRFTGLIHNTNLSYATEPKHIIDHMETARRCAEYTGLPLVATSVDQKLAASLPEEIGTIFGLDLKLKLPFDPNA